MALDWPRRIGYRASKCGKRERQNIMASKMTTGLGIRRRERGKKD